MVPNKTGWHDARRARIRYSHPEVRELYGHDGRTALAAIGAVGAQFLIARSLKRAALGPWLGATLVVGPTLAHAIGVLIHEATHNLISKDSRSNKAWGLFLNLPLGAPAAVDFRAQHLLHHRHLGETDAQTGQDTQAPTLAEDEWVAGSTLRKLLSFTVGRFHWKGRPSGEVPFDSWKVANYVTAFGALGLVGVGWGAAPALYLLFSSLLAFGPHTFGARRLSEHLPVRDEQPTNSYYGFLNWVSFNVGYHVEHHDFPNIPWTKIRELRSLAADEYASLFAFESWTRLLLDYFLDERYRVRHYVGLGEALGEDAVPSGSVVTRGPASARAVDPNVGRPPDSSGEEDDELSPGRSESGFFETRSGERSDPHAA